MHTAHTLLVQRLAVIGVARPTPALLGAIEARLAPRLAALIERSVTKAMVARAFASTLVDANQGSPEGGGEAAPVLASSPAGSSCAQQDKPKGVAGAPITEAT
jgi:hypothetical protein